MMVSGIDILLDEYRFLDARRHLTTLPGTSNEIKKMLSFEEENHSL